MKDTCGIHAGYIRDSCGIHAGYMYLQRFEDTLGDMQDTCGINARYMRDTCGIHVSAVVRGYMRDTCGILPRYILGYVYLKCILRGTYLRCRILLGCILMYLDVS